MVKIIDAAKKYEGLMLNAEKTIWQHPELGFKEYFTSEFMERNFIKLGYKIQKPKDITGFCSLLDTGKKGPEIMILAEMDAIICTGHKEAENGVVHACGHNVQCATILGVAAMLKEKSVSNSLCGKIRFCIVPAEELIDLDFRKKLKNDGVIKYLTGKAEFMHRGYFDNVDIAFMVHASNFFCVNKGNIACISKTVKYKGKSAHAGGNPWDGKNALYAAMQGINAVNCLRETFKEENMLRFHPIISKGGDAVNVIPDLVVVESMLRGKNYDMIFEYNKKINLAFGGGAISLDCNIEIEDSQGYSPLYNNKEMIEVVKEASESIIPEEKLKVYSDYSSGSTDMGDLSGVIPIVHLYSGGAKGMPHSVDYCIEDPYRACVKSAMLQVKMLDILLDEEAKRAKDIIENFVPRYSSKRAFLEFVDRINSKYDIIQYGDEIKIKLPVI